MAVAQSLPQIPTYDTWRATNEVNGKIQDSLSSFQQVITSAQLLALRATPVKISVTPNASINPDEVLIVRSMNFKYIYNGTAYTLNAGTLKVFYGLVASAHAMTADLSALLLGVVNRYSIGVPPLATLNVVTAEALALPIYLGNDGAAEFTLGNGTLTVTTLFSKTTP